MFLLLENPLLRHHDDTLRNLPGGGMGMSVLLHRFRAHLVHHPVLQDPGAELRLLTKALWPLHSLLSGSDV